jgi:hypothetical protein
MRRSIPVLCVCLALGWASPAVASEGPPPVQRPGQAKPMVEPAPVEPAPVEPAPVMPVPTEPAPVSNLPAPVVSELPRYDTPIVREQPLTPIKPRDPRSEKLIIAGSVLFCAGFPVTTLAALELASFDYSFGPSHWKKVVLGVGLTSIATGATLLGVGITRHKRWKKSLADGPARVQVQPTIGFGQLGVAGRF